MEKTINVSEKFTVTSFLSTESDISRWNLEGLPNDDLSVQNGILTVYATSAGYNLVNCKYLKKGGFKVIYFHMDFMKHIIVAIKNSSSVLIENLDENIDANIYPVLKRIIVKAGILKIFLDYNWIDVDSNFKLFMSTKLQNPMYFR